MNRKIFPIRALIVLSLIAMLGIAAGAAAGYNLDRWTVDSGGGTSNGGNYHMNATLGQPDAGALSGGNYRLEGGFWGSELQHKMYLPLLRKD